MIELTTAQQSQGDNSFYLLERRYEVLLDINNKKLLKEVNELREHVKRLESEIEFLKSSQKSLAQKTIYQSLEQRPVDANAETGHTNHTNESNSKQELRSEDVSIEKYFYFGKK